jgi:alpha-amylase
MIQGMVGFRRAVAGTPLSGWWDNGGNAVAFSRGNRGFVAINREPSRVMATVATPLAPGAYCDVLTGGRMAGACAGAQVSVTADGTVQLELAPDAALAIHAGSRL